MMLSVIVSTYNRPDALRAVLAGLVEQSDRAFEVLVADDGSGDETGAAVAECAATSSVPIQHVWHEDKGFRLSAIRNLAAKQAKGDYLVFIDGDCIPRLDFVMRHRALAEPGWMVAGNRLLLSDSFTRTVLERRLPIHRWKFSDWWRTRRARGLNRMGPLLRVPLGPLRKIGGRRWQRVRGCNMGIWKADLLAVNGFDETFEGWGYEDSDIAVRLVNAGRGLKKGAYACGLLHLWHRENDRRQEGRNWDLLQQRIRSRETQPLKGIAPNGEAGETLHPAEATGS
ncbi:MAG: glycosyltransferase family 2 protein [Burkholderiaceae bacterium]